MSHVVFDIGGTNMRVAFSDGDSLAGLKKIPTPQGPEEAVEVMRAYLDSRTQRPDGIAGGIAGVIRDGVVTRSPNLAAWNGFALSRALESASGLPISIRNDAETAGIGEAVKGAGKGYRRVAYLTIGTGVGGTIVVDGMIPAEAEDLEPGRWLLEDGRTFESHIGGASLEAEFGQSARELPRSVYESRLPFLVSGIRMMASVWAPDILILNGSLMNDENGFVLHNVVREVSGAFPIVLASFGDSSGLMGASVLAERA